MTKKKIRIAIDGPAGSGKSTVARQLAQRLKFTYLDTGAMYRALALISKERGVSWDDENGLSKLLTTMEFQFVTKDNGEQRLILNGIDVTEKIRTPEISIGASMVSRHPLVRNIMVEKQREFAQDKSIVMEGRDIGTVVLKDAELKIFLTAAPHERAKRRYMELVQRGEDVTFERVFEEISKRDREDSERGVAPLRPAEDSIVVDTTNMSIGEVVNYIISLVNSIYS